MARTTLRRVKLDEVSFVGKGDNKGANILLLKTHSNPIVALGKEFSGENKAEVLQNWFNAEISKADGVFKEEQAEMFADLLQEKVIRDKVWGMVWMLEDSICSILNDESGEDKSKLIQTTVEQFKTAISELTKKKGGDNSMNEEQLKAALAKAEADIASLTKQVETLTKERDEAISKVKPETPVFKMEDLPEPVRKQMETLEKQNKENAEQIEKMKEESLTKECEILSKEIPAISSDGVSVPEVLKELKKSSPSICDKVFGLLKAANTRIVTGGLFKEFGGNGNGDTCASAYELLVQKATELRKTMPELTKEQAFDRVYMAEDELRKRYNEEKSAR